MFFIFHIMFLMNTRACFEQDVKKLKSVTRKPFGGKSSSRALLTYTLFRVVVLPVDAEQR
jgi:hypothetical protein